MKTTFLLIFFILLAGLARAELSAQPSSFEFHAAPFQAVMGNFTLTAPEEIFNIHLNLSLSNADGSVWITNVSFSENPVNLSGSKKIGFFATASDIPDGMYFGSLIISNGSFSVSPPSVFFQVSKATSPGVIDYSPKGLQRSSSVLFFVQTNKKAICRYSFSSQLFELMQDFDVGYETSSYKTFQDLSDGAYHVFVVCKDGQGNVGGVYDANFSINTLPAARIFLNQSVLKPGLIPLTLTTTKKVFQAPLLSYSFDGGATSTSIPLSGSGTFWKGYFFIPASLGNAIGSFLFSARDLEGNTGTEILQGNVFVADTVKPPQIYYLDATGYSQEVQVRWHFEEEFDHFNVYRSTSPTPDYTDFYASVKNKEFFDQSVDKGNTYYYRVSAVDAAGNEGDLSKAIYATVLLGNATATTLAPALVGKVDKFLGSIDKLNSDIQFISDNLQFTSYEGLFKTLDFPQKLYTAKNELQVLRNSLEEYKNQDLSETELSNKLNAADVKISLIRKSVPEKLLLEEKKEYDATPDGDDWKKVISESYPAIDPSILDLTFAAHTSLLGSPVHVLGQVFSVVYLDGGQKEMTLIEKTVRTQNSSFIEYIPKTLAESTNLLDIKSPGFEVLKEDPFIRFPSSPVIYIVQQKIDLELLQGTVLVPFSSFAEPEKSKFSSITGYFVYGKDSFNWIFSAAALFILLAGFIFMRRMKRNFQGDESLLLLEKKISQAESALERKNPFLAQSLYREISLSYRALSRKHQKSLQKRISDLHTQYTFYQLRMGFSTIDSFLARGNRADAQKLFRTLDPVYQRLPSSLKSLSLEDYERIKEVLK